MSNTYTSSEMMTVCASRMLKEGQVCFVGIGMPSAAANLARLTRTPDIVLIYESGTIGTKPDVLPLSIGDGELAETADVVVSVPEMFRYWLQGEHIDVGFLGAAQIDKYANINTTVIGDYHSPTVRLPGAGGAPEISTNCKEVLIILKQNSRSFVEHMDFITSPGYLQGGDSREKLDLTNGGPRAVITDLGILEPDPVTKELVMTYLHPGVTTEQVLENTGWPLRIASVLNTTQPPTEQELKVLRDLNERTERAHTEVAS
ncbi:MULTISPECIES: CoA-transferase subunit beta [Photorhabdus]|uniref:CoA-transferase subunit beta n=1 Tax=unclassified Photorhabdus TaxID=2620880 RepID=UPI000ADCF6A2|nr:MULTISPECIES: CoA-transferase subunit beta [Photorhabdus]NHB59997.1 3-oxoadipate--succinyl-CoA transferase subunit B [Photorhabdus sp. RW14-46]RAW82383.1 3-oxoadipate--succinyl-CoA transferase subunit B [Photorhabdus sp. S5P8-50]AXG40986.1 3-oxoadipate--succinyl-CoA transferase subunit B [Photorhabdus laumondii subsp. laumondii]MCZ1251428.1 CoA-transferase subunit beta [Photorhabdus laumondii subsp. laumondii]NDL17838.1 CoA-transferase subunit beta [Photorhabdus laumondii subsp. laumondii]